MQLSSFDIFLPNERRLARERNKRCEITSGGIQMLYLSSAFFGCFGWSMQKLLDSNTKESDKKTLQNDIFSNSFRTPIGGRRSPPENI